MSGPGSIPTLSSSILPIGHRAAPTLVKEEESGSTEVGKPTSEQTRKANGQIVPSELLRLIMLFTADTSYGVMRLVCKLWECEASAIAHDIKVPSRDDVPKALEIFGKSPFLHLNLGQIIDLDDKTLGLIRQKKPNLQQLSLNLKACGQAMGAAPPRLWERHVDKNNILKGLSQLFSSLNFHLQRLEISFIDVENNVFGQISKSSANLKLSLNLQNKPNVLPALYSIVLCLAGTRLPIKLTLSNIKAEDVDSQSIKWLDAIFLEIGGLKLCRLDLSASLNNDDDINMDPIQDIQHNLHIRNLRSVLRGQEDHHTLEELALVGIELGEPILELIKPIGLKRLFLDANQMKNLDSIANFFKDKEIELVPLS